MKLRTICWTWSWKSFPPTPNPDPDPDPDPGGDLDGDPMGGSAGWISTSCSSALVNGHVMGLPLLPGCQWPVHMRMISLAWGSNHNAFYTTMKRATLSTRDNMGG
jgi:hypothetical protein